MKSNKEKECIMTVLGFLIACAGIIMTRTLKSPEGMYTVLPYILIGVGCGMLGQGAGCLITRRTLKNDPAALKKLEIDANDERNIQISYRAKAKAYDLMIILFSVLMMTFALMGVNKAAILLLVGAYLLVIASSVYYRSKYEKEM